MRPKSSDDLAVWLGSDHVATLTRLRDNTLTLAYTPETIRRLGTGTICLSVAIPVRDAAYRGTPAEWWAEGLLPEGETRSSLEDHFFVRRGDTFGLLRAIGRDCAGAVSFLSIGEAPTNDRTAVALDDLGVADALADLPSHPLGAQDDVPVSLAGLQAKLLLVRTANGWARPTASTPSTHILKPDPPQWPGLVAAEALALTAARHAGLVTADVKLERIDDRDVLIVTRFDRTELHGLIRRIHQEDGCQALGINPTRDGKYQRAHRPLPSYEALARLLMTHAVDPPAELAALAASMVVNVALGNADAHARNHSFLLRNGQIAFAPLYDVAPTVAFARSRNAGLWVCGESSIDRITATHLTLEVASWGIPKRQAAEIVTGILQRLTDAIGEAHASIPQVPAAIVDEMRARTRRLLSP